MNPCLFFKALADDTRLTCLLLLQLQGELCVCDLMSALQISQPKMSRHLALLKKAHLVRDRRQAQWIYYSLNTQMPAWAFDVIKNTAAANGDYLAQAKPRLGQVSCC